MRLNKIFAVAALAALTLSAFAQVNIVRLGAYDRSQANWWNQTWDQVSQNVFDPNAASLELPLYFDVIPDQEWVQTNPAPGLWSTVLFTIIYDVRYIDFVVFNAAGDRVALGASVPNPNQSQILSPFIGANTGAATYTTAGVPAGEVVNIGGTLRRMSLVLGGTTNQNGDEFNDSGQGFGYAKNFLNRQHGPIIPGVPAAAAWARRLIFVELKPQAIARDLGGALVAGTDALRLSVREQQRFIKVSAAPFPGSQSLAPFELQAAFLVPEPASMIALGSGLVGLLALRRRKK